MTVITSIPSAIPTTASQPTAAIPADSGDSGGPQFASLMHSIRAEVAQFISRGDAASSQGLTPEGHLHRLRSQGVGAALPMREAFLAEIAPWAKAAAKCLGVAPEVISAH